MTQLTQSPLETGVVAIGGRNIVKTFGHVRALIDASIEVFPGEVVAMFGDNGAGKSTFLKSLLGIYRPDGGSVIMGGEDVQLDTIRSAQGHGVEAVHQDLALAPDLSVVDNMFLGHEVLHRGIRGRLGMMARRGMAERADQALRELSIKLPSLHIPIRDLSGGQRQAVAIARAVMWARTAVLLDEPTAALGARQSEIVCELLRTIAQRNLGVLLVSHDLPRALKASDRVTILHRGRSVRNAASADLTVPDVVATMVGYNVEEIA